VPRYTIFFCFLVLNIRDTSGNMFYACWLIGRRDLSAVRYLEHRDNYQMRELPAMAMQQHHIYPIRYFDLQLTLARELAARLGQSFADLLLHYTALYKILGIEGDFDAQQPVWQTLLKTAGRQDAATDVHRYYVSRLDVIPRFIDQPHWGCFAYDCLDNYHTHRNVIRLHFSNQDDSSYGTLSRERMPARRSELAEMFAHIAVHEPQAITVCGASWLYNREAYRRLFPPSYTTAASLEKDEPHYQFRALWGKFLLHDWTVNEALAADFLQRVVALHDAGQVAACFPYQVLLASSPIGAFFEFYRSPGDRGPR
jgi:hypothetical protein